MKILLVLLFIAYWILAGVIAFFIEAKMEHITCFGCRAKDELKMCLVFGLFALIYIVGFYLVRKIDEKVSDVFDKILKKMNER